MYYMLHFVLHCNTLYYKMYYKKMSTCNNVITCNTKCITCSTFCNKLYYNVIHVITFVLQLHLHVFHITDPKTGFRINNTFKNLRKAGQKFTLRQVQEAIKDLEDHKAKTG